MRASPRTSGHRRAAGREGPDRAGRDPPASIVAVDSTLALTLFALVAAVPGGVIIARRRSADPLTLASVAIGLTASAVTGGVILLALERGLRAFALMHLVYLGVVLTLPVLGAVVGLTAWRRGGARLVAASAAVLLVPGAVGLYATHIEPHWLRVDSHAVAVAAERTGEDPVRIAVVADYQTSGVGDHERAAIDAVLGAEPDIIVLPGDLFDGSPDEQRVAEPAIRAQLERLTAPGGVFYVRGDVDGGGRAERILSGTGIRMLDDEVVDTRVGDRTVRIGGTRLAYDSPEADAVRAELLATPEDGAVTILLSHRPDTALSLPPSSRVDLTIAGHTHGGQIVVPGFGPPLTLSDVPRDVARGGLHRLDGNQIYVSPGVGVERGAAPQVRLFNRPAVGILTLDDR